MVHMHMTMASERGAMCPFLMVITLDPSPVVVNRGSGRDALH